MAAIKPVLRATRSMAPMPPAGEALDALGQLVVDVGGGDHGQFAFGSGMMVDAVEDLRWRSRRILRLRSRAFLQLCFRGLSGE